MGATLIVDDPELVLVLSGTHLSISERWKAELALQREEEIWWYEIDGESNRVRSQGSTMVYPLCYSCLLLQDF